MSPTNTLKVLSMNVRGMRNAKKKEDRYSINTKKVITIS